MLNTNIVYTVTAQTPDGCVAKDEISVKVVNKVDIYVPSGFTPNNDGLNDVLKAIPIGIKDFRIFTVYNRWGQVVFQTKDPSRAWNGMFNGTPQSSDVYVWIAEGISFFGEVIKRKGTVVIIR
jgi:gliding motility-associated-like protein